MSASSFPPSELEAFSLSVQLQLSIINSHFFASFSWKVSLLAYFLQRKNLASPHRNPGFKFLTLLIGKTKQNRNNDLIAFTGLGFSCLMCEMGGKPPFFPDPYTFQDSLPGSVAWCPTRSFTCVPGHSWGIRIRCSDGDEHCDRCTPLEEEVISLHLYL